MNSQSAESHEEAEDEKIVRLEITIGA